MNNVLGNPRLVALLLAMDAGALWYRIAGGRFSNSLLVLAGAASLGLLPPWYSAGILVRHKWLLTAAGLLFALGSALNRTLQETAGTFMVPAVVFALGFGAVAGYAASVRKRRNWVFHSFVAVVLALAVWGFFFAVVIAPQNQVLMAATGDASDTTQDLWGVFYFGNNYYTLTYYLLVPVAAGSLILGEGASRRSLLLLLAGVVCLTLAIIFGRRAPVVTGVVTWVFVGVCVRGPGRSLWRTLVVVVGISACLAGATLWLLSRDWGADVLESFQSRSEVLLEDARWELWSLGMEAVALHPFGGGRARFQGKSAYAHNAVLDIGLDLGVAGAVVFALFLGQIAWWVLARLLKSRQPLDGLEICLIAVIVAHLLIMMGEPLLPERVFVLLWAGVTLSCLGSVAPRNAAKRLPT